MSLRWGFLGAGTVARKALAPAVHAADGAVLQAAAARDAARAAALEPAGASYGDYAQLLADPAVDLVYVALANDAHLSWTLRSLAAGKHVLCEKPMALCATDVDTLAAAADAAGRLLVEATWCRWHPRTRRAEQLIADGSIGAVREVEAAFCSPSLSRLRATDYRLDPARGGGALYDIGHYALSAATSALGALQAESATLRRGPSGIDVDAEALLSGDTGVARVRACMDGPDQQVLRVRGASGSVELSGPAYTSWHQRATLRLDIGGRRWEEVWEPIDAYRCMVEAVSRRAQGDGDAFVIQLADSRRTAAAIDAVRAVGPAA